MVNNLHKKLETNFINQMETLGYKKVKCKASYGKRPDILMIKTIHGSSTNILKAIWGEVVIHNFSGFPSESEAKKIIYESRDKRLRKLNISDIIVHLVLIQNNAVFRLKEIKEDS